MFNCTWIRIHPHLFPPPAAQAKDGCKTDNGCLFVQVPDIRDEEVYSPDVGSAVLAWKSSQPVNRSSSGASTKKCISALSPQVIPSPVIPHEKKQIGSEPKCNFRHVPESLGTSSAVFFFLLLLWKIDLHANSTSLQKKLLCSIRSYCLRNTARASLEIAPDNGLDPKTCMTELSTFKAGNEISCC